MTIIKLNKFVLFVLTLKLKHGFPLKFEKPVAESIWKQPCSKNAMILNDCNWCHCVQSRYSCDARVCQEVDMFGHFNDAIQDLNVGMEGHGVWRANQLACDRGVHYQRGNLLCICTDEGTWPSPVCRDTFRVLHPVEVVKDFQSFKEGQCEPAKLYLIGCNVCFCPADSIPNPKFCTTSVCAKNDPVFDLPKISTDLSEVYVECDVNSKYKLGCRNCVCLENNRLLCDNCTDTDPNERRTNHCENRKPGELFNVNCNTCQCDAKGLIYCTVKNCLKSYARTKDDLDDADFELVDKPLDDTDCVVDTKYKKDCNTCYCFKRFGVKKFGCTVESCSTTETIHNGCVEGYVYEKSCLSCQCVVYTGKKMEICEEIRNCKRDSEEIIKVTNWVGYCEPMKRFMKDCNPCECLADGRTARCLAARCPDETREISQKTNKDIQKPIAVEIVPVVRDIGTCEKGSTFKIDCNLCLCLANNDVICSTADCTRGN